LLALAAGVLTAVWFYPPFGTPWVDQTAFFFGLLALAALLWGVVPSGTGRLRTAAVVCCGCLAFLSFASKQNVGAFLLLLYPVVIAVAYVDDPRRLLRGLGLFVVGFGAGLAVFLVWLGLASDLGTFVEYFFRIPSQLGSERLGAFARSWFGILKPYFGGRGPLVVNIMVWASLAVAVYAALRLLLRRSRTVAAPTSPTARCMQLSITVCIYLILFQHLFMNTTLNQPENALGFFGIIFALAMGLLPSTTGGRDRKATEAIGHQPDGDRTGGGGHTPGGSGGSEPAAAAVGRAIVKTAVIVCILVAVVLASVAGVRVSMDRKVHDILRGSTYPEPLSIAKLRHLIWAEPTRMGGFNISRESVVRLYSYLEQRGQNFFMFPDFTIFYGLLGVPSPQPVLWFHEGVTYSRASNRDLDERIVRDLESNDIRIFVLEQVAWFNTGERLDDFPRMKAYLMKNFARAGQIETFSVYEKVPPGS
jgi:hypothetical protein